MRVAERGNNHKTRVSRIVKEQYQNMNESGEILGFRKKER